ncbi:MAG: transcription antitermination factor NusB [Clostridia bacterium]|nr:transcription antitermination factor NusB [Clostridia bacterium]
MTRHEEREQAFLLLFEMTFGEEFIEDKMESAVEARSAVFTEFSKRLVNGVTDYRIQLDDRLAAHSKNWRLDRISRVALTALRLAAYEMLYCDDIPDSVAINEAVELVKAFGGEEDGAFVNGVLGGLSRAGEAETANV